MPGCGSATEISQAEELGVEIVKVFTGSAVGGPGFVRAVLAPLPWTRFMPAAGVDAREESIRTWFGACVAYQDGTPSPVVIIDQRTTYWAPKGPSWHPGYERLPVGRGGVLLQTFDAERIQGELDDRPAGEVSRAEVWSRIAFFYERIVPVAEEARVRLATHPDDPPMAYCRGVEQALVSFEGLKRLVELVPSPYNGLLLCLGCMQEVREDVPEVIRHLGQRNKIFYVHFRNVVGKVPRYREVFPDQGDGDMVANLRALIAVGYRGYLVPDHHFGFAGDGDWAQCSRAWQVGYIRGLMQALGI